MDVAWLLLPLVVVCAVEIANQYFKFQSFQKSPEQVRLMKEIHEIKVQSSKVRRRRRRGQAAAMMG